MEYRIFPFMDAATNAVLYQQGHLFRKAWGVVKGFLRRGLHVWQARQASYILLHREATPLGPPVVEWLLAKLFRKKIIYDFDDAIWLPNTSGANRMVARLKWPGKVARICRWSYKVSGGNEYLCHYAARYNDCVVLNPTTIDTVYRHNRCKDQQTEMPVIGWTGSHSTLPFLEPLCPVLQKLAAHHTFRVVVIADRPPAFHLDNLTFVPWRESSEIEDLLQINIGLMPLTEDSWAEGKCGFKALQYLALGIPAVISPVGVNRQIVETGVNGYLCTTQQEWYDALARLITDPPLRAAMGAAGRRKVEANFSVKSNQDNFLNLFR